MDVTERELRRIAKRYKIPSHSISDPHQWPATQQSLFQDIRKNGDKKFDTFCASIDIRSNDEPWRERTKYRAVWLAKRASQFSRQQRNEAGWRFGLENDVFGRFSVEVACPKCRARIWRSEIEACINQSRDIDVKLEERRNNRKPCNCPPEDRPQDYYEIGTNPLFDERMQEGIIHDPLLQSELPKNGKKREPDRIIGLQATKNFEKLLPASMSSAAANSSNITLEYVLRGCPFKDEATPLLFLFLIVEAKSEKSSKGFNDIQWQTAFPIYALLKLQADLIAQVPDGHTADRPLLWYFAYRGDSWRVHGCCLSDGESSGYDIFQLWDGSIKSKDHSLQLLLIVDYIFDWARDIYRPSILRQLKSILTGTTFDQVTLTEDSDIVSTQRNIMNWIQAPPSTITQSGFEQNSTKPIVPPRALDHQSLLPSRVPNTKLGTLRSAALVESRVEGLYITGENAKELLQLAGGEEPARQLVNFLSKWDELFLLTGDDLDDLEKIWTGKTRTADEASVRSSNSKFYVLIEMKTFINTSWTIVREITYLAVSEAAFGIIVNRANFRIHHSGKHLVPKAGRPCSNKILTETLRCLASSSPSQLFIAATACICLSLYSLPERKCGDYVLPTEALGLGHIRQPRLPWLIQRYFKIGKRKERTKFPVPNEVFEFSPKQRSELLNQHSPKYQVPGPEDLSFIRVSENMDQVSGKDFHEETKCQRCVHVPKYDEKQHHLTASSQEVFSASGLNLVVSLNMIVDSLDRNDMCLFAVEAIPEFMLHDVGLAVIVEDLLQSGNVYHTIRHPVKVGNTVSKKDTIWNLPLPYRPITDKERMDILDWVEELKGHPTPMPAEQEDLEHRWDGHQLLLHFLGKGYEWVKADQEVKRLKK